MFQPRHSIQRTLLQVLIIILVLIALVFSFAVVTLEELGRSQSDFAGIISRLQTSVELVTSLQAPNTRALDSGAMSPELAKLYERVDESLASIQDFLPASDNPLFYYRTLVTMFDYYRQETLSLIKGRIPPQQIVGDRSYLRALYSYMVRRAQQLTISIISVEMERQTAHVMAANRSTLHSFALVIFVEACGLVIAILLIRRINLTIHHLADYAGSLARKDWDIPDLEYSGYEDLQPVVDAFNGMKHSMVSHITEMEGKHRLEAEISRQSIALLEQGKLLRESQLVALQSQMNPHFLFNTLNVIARTALGDEPEETVALIQAMSEILRFNLQNLRHLVPLREELESVQGYILIQQRRFADSLAISMQVEEDVPLDILVPPMIIQPLIENAIQHGLDGKLFNRCLWGRVFRGDPGQVGVSIEDNGAGMPRQLVESLNEFARAQDSSMEAERIGLRSVIRRIGLAFGDKGRVRIESQVGVFTRVTLLLPETLPESEAENHV